MQVNTLNDDAYATIITKSFHSIYRVGDTYMGILGQQKTSRAFALPTVLIASVVLLSILAVSVTATATVRTALQNQYYVQLAQVAGEAGVAYAKACLAANANVPQWTNAKPLTPATDCAGNVILSPSVKLLVVAGGGGGGGTIAGGGGGGGVIQQSSYSVTATSYSVTVGSGGSGAVGWNNTPGYGGQGGNSIFGTLTAIGGGGGGAFSGPAAGSGGSGGGGTDATLTGGAGTAGQGYQGGTEPTNNGNVAAGGGGAGGVGGNATASQSGNGGPGILSTITGASLYYAGGGGAGARAGSASAGSGGIGGGGNATTTSAGAGAGQANTGGGGAGAGYDGGTAAVTGGVGGSGVVIITYPIDSGITATGVLTAGNTPVTPTTTNTNYKVFKFTGSGTFTVTSLGSASCPSDPRCSVTVNGNVRSSFSVAKPTVDSNGRALTIPNSGYVQITRTSNGSVWRTYQQPSVQAAVVPDLCSGNATAARGWNQAVLATQQDSIASATSAQSITISSAAINAGSVYYRKDFNVSANATYNFNIYTPSSNSSATAYIDGVPITTTAGSLSTVSPTLTAGCHVLVVNVTNQTYLPQTADFTASLTRSGAAAPIVVSDTSWRVTSGDAVHYSTNNYQETTGAWEPVAVAGIWNNSSLPWAATPADWGASSKDTLTEWITTNYSSGGLNRPFLQYAWFRQAQPFTTNTATTVLVSAVCDNSCDVYLDGNLVFSQTYSQGTVNKAISVQPGTHTFGVRLYNDGASVNPGAFLMAAYDTVAAKVIARSDAGWDGTTSWTSTAADLYSYDGSFVPTPAVSPTANAKLLVVGGGGGGGSDMGGGGGGGAVVSNSSYPLIPGTYNVVVGSGGTGAPAGISQVRGSNGGTSYFGSVRALGGGGGGSEYSTNASPPGSGATAGGSAAYLQTYLATPVIGLGYGSVATLGAYYPTGGGGAGGPGAVNPATGGVGVQNAILGASNNFYWGGGGGGSGYTPIGGNGGAGGGGGGAVGVTTGGSGINAGSPGGGGVQVAQTNKPGGNGGAFTGGGGGGGSHYNSNNYGGNGGSGVVIVSFPTGSMTVSLAGSYQDWSAGTPGFTTYLFYGSGTFTVNSIGASSARSLNLLAVAGGGGGGNNGASGGGGGGGVISSIQSISTTGSFPVVVGAGGSANSNGINTSVFGFTAIGGGAGIAGNGIAGGSGGGSARGASPANYAAAGTAGQGNAGGSAGFTSGQYPAAGGGGAGGPGASVASASPGTSGAGGVGIASTITGSSVYYAGGGGGGGDYGCSRGLAPGAGGNGGGGAGGDSVSGNGVAGTANTGGGGGGATQLSNCSTTGVGGAGGSGVVIISYLTGTLTATGGTITTSGSYTIHTFTSNGTFTVLSIN